MEVTKWLKPSDSVPRIGGSASVQAATRVNVNRRRRMTPPESNDSTTYRADRRPTPRQFTDGYRAYEQQLP